VFGSEYACAALGENVARIIIRHLLRLSIWATVGAICGNVTSANTGRRESQPRNEAERQISTLVTSGRDAVLDPNLPPSQRTVRSVFLERLLTGTGDAVKVPRHGVRISGAVISDPFNLSNAEISCETWFLNCHFTSDVFLSHTLFRHNLALAESSFDRQVDMTFVSVGGTLWADRTHFGQDAYFEGLNAAEYLLFRAATFEGPVTFRYAAAGLDFGATEANFLSSSETECWGLRVGADAFFAKAVFNASVDFRSASAGGTFDLTGAQFKAAVEPLRLALIKYRRLEPKNDLLALATASSPYDLSVYTDLEEYFKRLGDVRSADLAYIARRRREGTESHGFARVWNIFLDWSVGYGRRTERGFLWGIIIVFAGWLLFRDRAGMSPQKGEYSCREYSAFWYSLDLFLPVIDLQARNVWMPEQKRRFARNYARFQTVSGWIVLTLGLGAVTGLLK